MIKVAEPVSFAETTASEITRNASDVRLYLLNPKKTMMKILLLLTTKQKKNRVQVAKTAEMMMLMKKKTFL